MKVIFFKIAFLGTFKITYKSGCGGGVKSTHSYKQQKWTVVNQISMHIKIPLPHSNPLTHPFPNQFWKITPELGWEGSGGGQINHQKINFKHSSSLTSKITSYWHLTLSPSPPPQQSLIHPNPFLLNKFILSPLRGLGVVQGALEGNRGRGVGASYFGVQC